MNLLVLSPHCTIYRPCDFSVSHFPFLGLSFPVCEMGTVCAPPLLAALVNTTVVVTDFVSWPMTVGRVQSLLYPHISPFLCPSHIRYDARDEWVNQISSWHETFPVCDCSLSSSSVLVSSPNFHSSSLMDIFSWVTTCAVKAFWLIIVE